MKKIVCFIFACMSLFSCGDDDNTDNSFQITLDDYPRFIIGEWRPESFHGDTAHPVYSYYNGLESHLVFKKDAEYMLVKEPGVGKETDAVPVKFTFSPENFYYLKFYSYLNQNQTGSVSPGENDLLLTFAYLDTIVLKTFDTASYPCEVIYSRVLR